MDIIIDFCNFLIEAIADAVGWVIDFLPNSPISNWTSDKPQSLILGHITWFIPFPTMLLHFSAILVCIAIYYSYRVVGRWLQVVRG